jgi:acetylornithine deacetylase/succinyl-diaminopimelate desuccinylase-like protein
MALVREQVSLGPRVPGTPPHDLLVERLEAALRSAAAEVTVQQFTVPFRGRSLPCRNVVGVFRAAPDVAAPARRRVPALLLGTHFDTRIRADRDPDPSRREQPIPGANDGGSGTAILLHMLPGLAAGRFAGDLAVAFLDAEDLGNIDGKEFALGAAWLARHPVPGFVPEQAVMLDMVGGRRMILDIDAHSLAHLPSRRLTTEVFAAAASRGSQPFARDKPRRLKYIISDHAPFVAAGVAACILIDIDYPEWHTQADLPGAMSEESLAAIEEALWLFLSPRRC